MPQTINPAKAKSERERELTDSRRNFARPVKSVGLFGVFLKSAAIIFCVGFLFFGLASHASAATRTASVSGDWNNTATWGGAIPGTGDLAQINGDIIVTIPIGVSATAGGVTIGVTNNSVGISTLINNGTLTLDNATYLRVGQGASKDGKLILGPSSTIINPTGIYLNNSIFQSTATKANPAKITGAGGISNTVSGPKQDINISNISFQNTGAIVFALSNTTGSQVSSLTVADCVFSGNGGITFGSTDTPNATVMSITNSDFRNVVGTKTIIIRRITGGTSTYLFNHNIVNSDTHTLAGEIELTPTTSGGLIMSNNVFINTKITTDANSSDSNINNNFFAIYSANGTAISMANTGYGTTINRNYFRSVADNLLAIKGTGTGGTGEHIITNNVLDGDDSGGWDKPDLILTGSNALTTSVMNNLVIGNGEIITPISGAFLNPLNLKNNTLAVTGDMRVSGHIIIPEGPSNTGTINIVNNLHRALGSVIDISIGGSASGADEIIAYSDYNDFYSVAIPYQLTQLTVSSGQTHDLSINPSFVDETRTIAKWNLNSGSGTDSAADGITYLLSLNGYDSTNKDQNGTVSTYGPSDLLDWVRAGFAPTNTLLKGAGDPADGSPDIGAVPVADIVAPTVTAFTIPATATSLTVSVSSFTATDLFGVTGYKLTETNVAPAYDAAGWTGSAPTEYTFASAGAKTLYAWAKDAVGNVSTSMSDTVTINLDAVAPTTSASPDGGTYGATQSVTLTCTDNDGGMGCDTIYYTTNGTDPTTGSTAYTVPISIPVNTTLKFFSVDLNSNEEVFQTETYIIDTTGPAIAPYTPANSLITIQRAPTFTWEGSDNTSGIADYALYLDNANVQSDTTTTYTPASLSCGAHSWYVKATDVVGNSTDSTTFNLTVSCPSGGSSSVGSGSLGSNPAIASVGLPKTTMTTVAAVTPSPTPSPSPSVSPTPASQTSKTATASFNQPILIRYTNSPKVYLIENNQQRWITDEKVFTINGFKWSGIRVINANDAKTVQYVNGENVTGKISSSAKATEDKEAMAGKQNLKLKTYLKQGSKGSEVKILQTILKQLGFFDYPEITGYFGPVTRAALIKFQLKYGLKPAAGFIGPQTLKKLNGE